MALFSELFAAQVGRSPAAVAVLSESECLTYGELDARARHLAQRLQALGVGPDTVVGICAERAPGMLVALLGVMKAGGAYLPLDPEYPRDRTQMMLEDSAASVLAVDAALAHRLPAARARLLTLDIPDEAPVAGPGLLRTPLTDDQLAYVLFTSGSTGRPKGVGVTQKALANVLTSVRDLVGFETGDRMLALTPLSFDIAAVEMFVPLLVGGSVFIAGDRERRDGLALTAALARSGATVMQATPSGYRVLLESGWQPTSMKLISGGEALTGTLAVRLKALGARLWNGYGPTETAVYSTFHSVTESAEQPVPIGRAVAGNGLRVLDERLDDAPVGAPGELFIAGKGVARGYLGRPGMTAERFLPDPEGMPGSRMYRTGDRVRRQEEGCLQFLGRLDDQVKVRGNRVELGEVEAALARHEAVAAAAVSARLDSAGGTRLVAYLVPRAPLRCSQVRAWLRERVPDSMLPSAFVVMNALPLTPSGKVNRLALPEPAGARPDMSTVYVPPRDPLQEELIEMWEEVLGVQPVGIEDGFLDLGGDSLQATLLIARTRRSFGVELDFAAFMESLTVALVAERLHDAPPPLPAGTRAPTDHATPSSAQQGVWFQEQLDPGTPVFNIPLAYRLRGPLDGWALELSMQEVVLRHSALRTRLESPGGRPRCVIDRNPPFDLAFHDLTGLQPPDREAGLAALLRREATTPFDLSVAPLLRASLVRCADDDHVLLLTMHHIISDAWSVSVMVDELRRLYAAYREGLDADLEPPPAEGATSRDERLPAAELEAQLRYWNERLQGMEQLALPADAPRPARRAFGGARHSARIGAESARRLKELSRLHAVTLFMTLLAAFQVLAHRLSGQDDIVVGTPVAGRNRSGVERSIGFFINLLVLRADLSGNPPFSQLLGRVKQAALGAYANEDVPFERVVEELHPRRDPSRNPLFQVLFNMYNFPSCDLRLDGLEVETLNPPMAGSLFDLTLYAREDAGALQIDVVYDPAIFSAERIRMLVEQYVHLLEEVERAPETGIDVFSLLPADPRRLPDPTQPLAQPRDEQAIASRLQEHAAADPARPALDVEHGEAWTYADLDLRSAKLAVALVAAGATGHVVAVHGGRGAGLVCGLVGVLKAGSAFLVLDPSYPPARLVEQVRLAAPRFWISAGAQPSPELAAALAGARRVEVDRGPGGARLLVEPDLDRLAYVAFTSGSTGRPKGVLGSERPVAHFLGWHAARFQLGASDRFAMLSGLAYDPLLRDVFTPLWVGARLCIPSPETLLDPDRLVRWLADRLVTVVHATPALMRLLATNGATLPSLSHVFVGGDMLTGADAARLHRVAPNARLVNFYGTTETPQAVAYHELGDMAALRDPVPIGSGIEGVQLLLLNPQGRQAGVGELAEVHVRSPYLALGYLDDPALTRERFLPNPFAKTGDHLYRTGDLGRYLPDGEVELVGRADDQVKVRGFRVELGEVAACLRRLEGVVDAAALAPRDGHAERRLVAYIVSRARLAPTLPEIRRGLQAWLPEYMLPSALVVLDSLPRLPGGKLDRSLLPEPESPRPELGPGYLMAGTPGERTIAQIWSDVLGIEHVGIRDNFFDLGGNSLAIAEVHSRLQGLGAKLSVVDLFRYPDIQSLAQQMESATQAKGSSRVEARRAAMARRSQARSATVAGNPQL